MDVLCLVFQGAGTDDQVLIEILASRSGEEIKEIIKVYKRGDVMRQTRAEKHHYWDSSQGAKTMMDYPLKTFKSVLRFPIIDLKTFF